MGIFFQGKKNSAFSFRFALFPENLLLFFLNVFQNNHGT